jgi:hypothetical protein
MRGWITGQNSPTSLTLTLTLTLMCSLGVSEICPLISAGSVPVNLMTWHREE